MTCCRCNRSGSCKNCSCTKEKRKCVSCLPGRLGRCLNTSLNPSVTDNASIRINPPVNIPSSNQAPTPNIVPTPTPQLQPIPQSTTPTPPNAIPTPAISPTTNPMSTSTPDATTTQISADTNPTPAPIEEYNFTWGSHSGADMFNKITEIYEEVIHWRHNLFPVPTGKAGNLFVCELARLLQAFADGSSLESVCMKAVTIIQTLTLQKPSRTSKIKDHIIHLKRRMDLWKEGSLEDILLEGKCIQKHLPKLRKGPSKTPPIAKTFQKYMSSGNVNKALRLLSRNPSEGVLALDESPDPTNPNRTTRDILEEKHPPGKPALPDNLLQENIVHTNNILFENLNSEGILKAALKTKGSAGLSGLDAHAWRRLCSSFKTASKDLCSALAAVGRRLCTDSINPDHLSAFVACRLIPLNKSPGVRPIGIGEVPRRIIAKAILSLLQPDIVDASGPLQVCAGQESGCEAAIHAMRQAFNEDKTEGVLLVDASNAFNSINRPTALHNISVICPPLSQVLKNTYQAPIRCVIPGNGEISSSEGTTQGDPLAMAMYALATRPLIDRLQSNVPEVSQVWYADDATGAASCSELRAWWDNLLQQGKGFGYFPNAEKTHLVVKAQYLEKAKQMFSGTNVNITTQGKRHLGAAIGSRDFTEQYVQEKMKNWTGEIHQLAEIASSQPHAAYAGFVHGLSNRWTYLQRTIPNIHNSFQPLEDAIHQTLIPALTGHPPCSKETRNQLALPARLGGMGLINPVETSSHNFQASEKMTTPLVEIILSQDQTKDVDAAEVATLKKDIRDTNRQRNEQQAASIYSTLPPQLKRQVDLAKERGASSWLSVLPLYNQGFHLHKGEFRDALCLRYGWTLPTTPRHCHCGKAFSVDHAMTCPTGGFPTIRHNEIRDITASLLTEVVPNVATEPHLQPLSGETLRLASANTNDGARLDIRARSFWTAGQDTFMDVRVFHPNAPSNRSSRLSTVYKKHEDEKKRVYGQRIFEVENGVFTPLVLSTTGGMGREAHTFYKRLADMLANKREIQYSKLMGWLRCKLSFAITRSAVMCIRGSRSSKYHPIKETTDIDIALACSEGNVPQQS